MLYKSYVHPLTILSTLPSAGLGALVTLMAFGFDFSLIALIGIILLIGIVKKNGIMLVDFAIEAQRNRGRAPVNAIREACLLRFRSIMMTTMAALLGGVPLMLGTGTGSEIRQPLGYAIVGGLIVSQALTLYTTPVVFLYLDRLNAWFIGASRPKPARMAGGLPENALLELVLGGDADVTEYGAGGFGKEALDKVEPRSVLGGEDELEAPFGSGREPSLGFSRNMRGVIVENDLDRG